jgi:hypothetical protein
MCGMGSWNQCQVPAGKRLIIEHVSGYAFLPCSPKTTISASLVIKDAQLGLNGNSFHSSVATKTYSTETTDVFVFLHTLEDDATSSGDLIFLKRGCCRSFRQSGELPIKSAISRQCTLHAKSRSTIAVAGTVSQKQQPSVGLARLTSF